MTKEQRDGIAQLIREHVKSQADNLILKKILSTEHKSGILSADWRMDFTLLQESRQYLRLIEEGEKDIAAVLAAIDRNEAISGFLKNPPKGPAN